MVLYYTEGRLFLLNFDRFSFWMANGSGGDWFVFSADLLVFLKYYDPRHHLIAYCGHLILPMNAPLRDAMPEMCKRAHLPRNSELKVYEVASAVGDADYN